MSFARSTLPSSIASNEPPSSPDPISAGSSENPDRSRQHRSRTLQGLYLGALLRHHHLIEIPRLRDESGMREVSVLACLTERRPKGKSKRTSSID
jgi:hypothetical protein